MSDKKGALFVCLGNICRSPIAEGVFLHLLQEKGFTDKWKVDSAALEGWHAGNSPEPRALATLRNHTIEYKNHARQIEDADFYEFDYIFGMDDNNILELERKAPQNSKAKIFLLGDFDPQEDRIIRDPYYDSGSDGFAKCYQQCMRSCAGFLEKIATGEV